MLSALLSESPFVFLLEDRNFDFSTINFKLLKWKARVKAKKVGVSRKVGGK